VYYSAFDEKIHEGVAFTAYSLWDTFRAEHPWLLLTAPDRVNDMITSLIQMYREGGWLPKWPNPTYTNIMIGTHADAVIADAYVNGYRDYDVQEAYRAVRKDAFQPPATGETSRWVDAFQPSATDESFRWGDRHCWNSHFEARGGLTNYIKAGYVASDKTDESVSRTLEFALDDYCVAQMARGLGYEEDYLVLMNRAANYRNVYNPQSGFFQARRSDGSWEPADTGFTEGANWTYRFCVMQDVPGMIELMGGKEQFAGLLDENFDGGHYRHDNEPGHHYAYLYNFCGRLDKTQSRISQIINANYQNKGDGLSGNDDCGQMSAWYLFSSLGFYPLTPASGEYALGKPGFEEAILHLSDNKKLIIRAKHPQKNELLTKIKFNGKELNRPFIAVKDILAGGVLEFLPDKNQSLKIK
jgi:predicted alpha-1,2-mannosidase